MHALSRLLVVGSLVASPVYALDSAVHFHILESMFQGDCGNVTPILNVLRGSPSIDFLFPDLSVAADAYEAHERKLCNVRLHVAMDDGYKIGLGNVFFQGQADINADAGSGNVSARAFFIGLPGVDGFMHFDRGFSNNFQVDADAGTPTFTACGGDTYLNLLVDLSARNQSSGMAPSEVTIHRGTITPESTEPSARQADVQCKITQARCRR